MGKINLLSKDVSELIAAGEVIDRPSAIVKELLENSIDSGASIITVEIKNGGRTYMRITDNGCGIAYEDVPTAFVRHATSKISSASDLDKILTLGFRGEALASVCAVAKVDLITKCVGDDLGTHYKICGAQEETYEQSGCPDGTTIIVRDIFYNVPARLKFLKKDVTEGNAIAAIVNKIALSHPEISFKFIRENKTELLTAGDGKLYSAVYSVLGKEFASSLIPVEYSYNGISVSGYITKPLGAKANHAFQNFFINKRYVKSMTCMHAIDEAYANLLMTGKVPACVMMIDLPPNIVDVNVHPTKIEVRFSNEKLIYESVYFAVKNALLSEDKETKMNLDSISRKNFTEEQLHPMFKNEQGVQLKLDVAKKPQDTPVTPQQMPPQQQIASPVNEVIIEHKTSDYSPDVELNNRAVLNVPRVETPVEKTRPVQEAEIPKSPTEIKNEMLFDSNNESVSSQFKYIDKSSFVKKQEPCDVTITEEKENEKPMPTPRVIGELFRTYIIVEAGEDMFLIDKHAAHERFIFEKIKEDVKNLDVQMLLEPVMVQLSFEEYDAICDNVEKAEEIGFLIEPDVAPTVAVKGVPLIISELNPADVVPQIAENFLSSKQNPQLDVFDELYHSIACKSAIKANDITTDAELAVIVKAVFNNPRIRYCPHGRPVVVKLSKSDIEKQFKRIV